MSLCSTYHLSLWNNLLVVNRVLFCYKCIHAHTHTHTHTHTHIGVCVQGAPCTELHPSLSPTLWNKWVSYYDFVLQIRTLKLGKIK